MTRAKEQDDAIDLPRFAEVTAHLRHFGATPSDEVIARLGLGKVAWEAATARWYAARDAELASGACELTSRFGRAFAKALRDLARRRPTLASLGPLSPPEPKAPSVWPPPLAPSVSPPPLAPSVSPPLAPSASPPLAPSVSPPPLVSSGRGLAATADISAVIQGRALPFTAPSAPIAAPPPPTPSIEERPPRGLGQTVAVTRDALKRSTPFLAPQAPSARIFATVGLAPGAGSAPPLPPGVPDLTLPQYASLRVELHTHPASTSATLARYGLGPETKDALDAHFRARFEVDPLLRMEFARAYATYLGWLRAQRGA